MLGNSIHRSTWKDEEEEERGCWEDHGLLLLPQEMSGQTVLGTH